VFDGLNMKKWERGSPAVANEERKHTYVSEGG
jgi:hypothetical protein